MYQTQSVLRIRRFAAVAVAAVALMFATNVAAEPLHTMTLEGQLLTGGGSPVPDGTYTVTVSFYKAKGDAKALFSQVLPVKTAAGGFVMTLGLKTALPNKDFYSGDAAWVGISVDADPELDRIPVNHVAYAMRADVADKLQCTGCIAKEHLASSVLAPYALKADLKFAVADQACGKGEVVTGVDAAGKAVCAKDSDTKYSGKDFAVAGQSCPKGEVVAGLDADGKVKCAKDANTTYGGKDFATANQACPKGQVVIGIDASGKATCAPDQKGAATGKDFALSNQTCGSGLVVKGIDAAGKPVCVKAAPSAPADALNTAQVKNLQANKLANGSSPWADAKYDINSTWLREKGDDAHFKQFGGKQQMVFRTDGEAQYNSGVGNAPFVFQYGGDVAANSVMKISAAGQLWLKSYGWLHTAFAKANKACPTNQVVRGFTSTGDPICIADQKGQSTGKDFALSNQSCASGQVMRGIDSTGKAVCVADKDTNTTYKAGTGITISGTTISGNFTYLDGRFVNEGQANSVTGAMVKDSTLTGADVANSSLTGSDIKDSSLSGADVANESLTGSDIKNGSVTGSDVASSTLTGSHVADSSLTGSDIKNGSITGSDVAASTLSGGHIANESLTGSDIKNGSITYSDTNVNSVQRRVGSSCPAGQAIRAISSSGTVTCESEVGDQKATYSGSVVNGNWYRIAASSGGAEVAATFTLYDTSRESQVQFRVAISSGDATNMHFNLISASHYSARLIDRVRVLEGGTSSAHYVDVKVVNNATMYVKIDDNYAQNTWTPQNPKSVGTSDTVSGYSARTFYTDRVVNSGDYQERLTVYRGGLTRVRSNSGYLDLHSDSGKAMISTDRSYIYMNKQLRVDSGYIGSYNEDLRLTTSGTQRMHINNSTGNVGIGANASASYRLYVSGNTYATGNSVTAGVVRADKGIQVDGKTVIDDGAGWHRSEGQTGWYSQTYGGGIYMTDTTWVKVYNNKSFYVVGNSYVGGSVGIGDSSPNYPLDVEKSSTNWLGTFQNTAGSDSLVQLADDQHGIYVKSALTDTTTGYIAHFRNATGDALTVENNRMVGIRDSSPSYELDVNGRIRATDHIYANKNLYVGGTLYLGSTTLASYIDTRVRNWVRAHCNVYIGQRDNTNTSTTNSTYFNPSYYVRMRADGYSYANHYGIYDSSAPYTKTYASFRMTGDVNSDDRLYLRFVCD